MMEKIFDSISDCVKQEGREIRDFSASPIAVNGNMIGVTTGTACDFDSISDCFKQEGREIRVFSAPPIAVNGDMIGVTIGTACDHNGKMCCDISVGAQTTSLPAESNFCYKSTQHNVEERSVLVTQRNVKVTGVEERSVAMRRRSDIKHDTVTCAKVGKPK